LGWKGRRMKDPLSWGNGENSRRLCFWRWSLEVGLQLLSLCLIFFRCADLVVLGLQSLQGISFLRNGRAGVGVLLGFCRTLRVHIVKSRQVLLIHFVNMTKSSGVLCW
jgi:hypothetical protein